MAVTEARTQATVNTNLYIDATNPADNSFLTLTAGVPAGGTHCGAVGAIGLSPGMETSEKDCENFLTTLGASISEHSMEITIRLREWTTEGMAWLLAARRSGAGMFGGSSTDLDYKRITVVFGLDLDSGLYAYFHAYKTYVSSPASLEPNKSDGLELEATLTCVADATKADDDNFWQIWNPAGYQDFA